MFQRFFFLFWFVVYFPFMPPPPPLLLPVVFGSNSPCVNNKQVPEQCDNLPCCDMLLLSLHARCTRS